MLAINPQPGPTKPDCKDSYHFFIDFLGGKTTIFKVEDGVLCQVTREACLFSWMVIYVCVCVCERERERERGVAGKVALDLLFFGS